MSEEITVQQQRIVNNSIDAYYRASVSYPGKKTIKLCHYRHQDKTAPAVKDIIECILRAENYLSEHHISGELSFVYSPMLIKMTNIATGPIKEIYAVTDKNGILSLFSVCDDDNETEH